MKGKILASLLIISWSLVGASNLVTLKPVAHSLPSYSHHRHNLFQFQLGGYWSSQGKEEHIGINGLIGDTFTLTKHGSSNGLVGIGYFFDAPRLSGAPLDLSYGVNFFYLPKTSVSGTVIQENLFSNLAYGYHLINYPVYAAAKIKTYLPHDFSLVVDVGAGLSFVHAVQLAEYPLDGITIPDHPFINYTTNTFSATAGLGLQIPKVFGETPLECGYRFFYLGYGRFSGRNQQILNNLHTGPIYANALLCSISV